MAPAALRTRLDTCFRVLCVAGGFRYLRDLPIVALHLSIRAPVLGRIESPIYCYFGSLQIQNENGLKKTPTKDCPKLKTDFVTQLTKSLPIYRLSSIFS